MATTLFASGTVITSSWLNEVDAVVWDIFGGASTVIGARSALGLGTAAVANLGTGASDAAYGNHTHSTFLPLAGGTLTGQMLFANGADIASATTVDLTAATGNMVRITGTTITTNVTLNNGQRVWCYAVGAWPLTYHATNLPLPGSVDYTCAAGDMVCFSKDGNGDKHVEIIKRDGTAVVIGASNPFTVVDAAGDLIVGTANDTVGRLAIGTGLQQLRVNSGATALEWFTASGSSSLITVTTFTGNGTWNKNGSTTKVVAMAVGGGGAGGGAGQLSSVESYGTGGQTGAVNWAYTASPASSYSITIGAGGTGVGAGNGNAGGNTTVGALLTAVGGQGGVKVIPSAPTFTVVAGEAGASCLGTGGAPKTAAGVGNAAGANSGAGGGGAYDTTIGNRAGGAGGSGLVIIWEFA